MIDFLLFENYHLAADLEVEFFQKNIDAFLDTIAFDKVAKQFANDITEQIKKN